MLSEKSILDEYKEQGYYLFKQIFEQGYVDSIRKDIDSLYERQFSHLSLDEGTFQEKLIALFRKDLQKYVHTNRSATMLSSVYELAYHPSIMTALKNIGFKQPILCQKPTLRMDCKDLAISKEYYALPTHQDYRAMQGSINSVVVSIPLVDVDESLGALMVSPESHKNGLLTIRSEIDNKSQLEAIKAVEIPKSNLEFKTVEQQIGDVLIISSFLVHKSGTNITNKPRYTILVRYNDLDDDYFVKQGFPHPFKMTHENTIVDDDEVNSLVVDYFS